MNNCLLIELLQVTLGVRDRLSRVPSFQDWEVLFEEARRHAIIGVLMDGIGRLPTEQLPPKKPILLRWIGMMYLIEKDYHVHLGYAKELTSRFSQSGFECSILKGLSAAMRYPIPSRRQCGDIDLWVNGRRNDIMAYLKSEFNISSIVWHHIVVNAYNDVRIEVHIHPSWLNNPFYNVKLQRWFDNSLLQILRQPVNKLGFQTTPVVFDAVYQIVHVFHHLLEEGIVLRQIVDYYYVLKNLNDEEREDAFLFLMKIGLKKFTAAMMYIQHEVCGASSSLLICEPDPKEGSFLLDEILTSGDLGHQRIGGNLLRSRLKRYLLMMKHYPNEVIWMVPWKIWHKGWRFVKRKYLY